MSNVSNAGTVRVLRLPEVIDRVGLSKSAIYDNIKAGKFPAPMSLGGYKAVGWRSTDIDAWIDGLSIACRSNGGKR